jgi:hypothetical protein
MPDYFDHLLNRPRTSPVVALPDLRPAPRRAEIAVTARVGGAGQPPSIGQTRARRAAAAGAASGMADCDDQISRAGGNEQTS